MKRILTASYATLLALASAASADDFDTLPLGPRFGSALFRLSTYPDVVAKTGAASASTENTSFNPAVLDWVPRSPRNPWEKDFYHDAPAGLSSQALDLHFQNDTHMFITAQSLLFQNCIAPMRFSFIQIRSSEDRLRGGPLAGNVFEYDLNAVRFEVGRRLGDADHPSPLALGLSLSYNESESNFFAPVKRGKAFVFSDRETFNVRFGWQVGVIRRVNKVIEDWKGKQVLNDDTLLWGGVVDFSHYTSKEFNPRDGNSRDSSRSVVARTGLAWKWWRQDEKMERADAKSDPEYRPIRGAGWLNVDYQWSWFEAGTDELQEHRLHVGVDYSIKPGVVASAGTVVDDRRNWSWGAGLKFHMITTHKSVGRLLGIDGVLATIAYQHDPLPEIGAEFGHSQLWAFAFGFAF